MKWLELGLICQHEIKCILQAVFSVVCVSLCSNTLSSLSLVSPVPISRLLFIHVHFGGATLIMFNLKYLKTSSLHIFRYSEYHRFLRPNARFAGAVFRSDDCQFDSWPQFNNARNHANNYKQVRKQGITHARKHAHKPHICAID